ncbi:MAG: hypothetical protein AAF805_00520 [Planctomycetota bacterium]
MQPDRAAGELPRAEVSLAVAVVDDPSLAAAIERQRGEWNALTGGEYTVKPIGSVAGIDGHDLIVFPSAAMGALCEPSEGRDSAVLRPVRSGVLKLDLLRFSDFQPVVREVEVVYGQRVMALPLGCATPLLVGGSSETLPAAVLSNDRVTLGLEYLAFAAPYAVHPSREATLFDQETMRPRLDTPPFVRAMGDLVDAVERSKGRTAASRYTWPQRSAPAPDWLDAESISPPLGVAERYNPLAGVWEPVDRADSAATLVASSGRLVGVAAVSRNAATAFRLAAWLAGVENAPAMAAASDGVAVCRGSFARSADAWRADIDRATARAFTAANADALRRRRRLIAPRLPGAKEYLAALGGRVQAAIDGEAVEDVLAGAVSDWDAITDRLGRPQQAAAYARSINAAPLE